MSDLIPLAALAEVKVELERREQCEHADDLVGALEELDAARAELAEWRKVAGVSTPDEMRQDNADIREALEAAADWKARAEQAEAAERRGAVAALRDLADDIDVTGYGWTHWTAADRFKERIRARADRIEGDES